MVLACATSLAASAQEAGGDDAATALRTLEHEWLEYLLRVRSAKPHLEQIVMEGATVRTFGGTAIVVGTYLETGVKGGKPWLKRWRFVDTWVYKKGRWMLVAAAAVPVSK